MRPAGGIASADDCWRQWAMAGVIGLGPGSPSRADDVPLESRRFTIQLQETRALDETGLFNSVLSDEIYAGFLTTFTGE